MLPGTEESDCPHNLPHPSLFCCINPCSLAKGRVVEKGTEVPAKSDGLWTLEQMGLKVLHNPQSWPFHKVLHLPLSSRGTHQGLKSLSRPPGPVRKDLIGVKANTLFFHLPLQVFGVCESVRNQSDLSLEGMGSAERSNSPQPQHPEETGKWAGSPRGHKWLLAPLLQRNWLALKGSPVYFTLFLLDV